MSTDLETDSELVYRRTLKTVDESLERRDIAALKFLCKDIIPSGKLEEVKRGLDLLVELERKHKLAPEVLEFLAEILMYIGRLDLVKKLGFEPNAFKATIHKLGPQTSKFRLMLQNWSDELTSSEVQAMKFLIAHHLRRTELDEAKTAQEVFSLLEKNQVIAPEDVSVLLEVAESLDRLELRDKVKQYQEGGPAITGISPTKTMTSPLLGNATNPVHNIPKSVTEGTSPTVPTKIHLDNWTVNESNRRSQIEDFAIKNPETPSSQAAPTPLPTPPPAYRESMELPCYKMDARPLGICVIINNQDFYKIADDSDSRRMPNRQGTNVDCDNLEYIFNKLGYHVYIYRNLTSIQMVQLLQEVAMRNDHSAYDCFTCCILTHGTQGQLYGVDGKLVEIRDLTNYFKASTCPSLKGKPKLFFIQACQGKFKQIGVDMQTDDPNMPQEHGMESVNFDTLPNESDFLMGYATLPGFVSYRSKTQGSWYITTLVQMLDKYADRYDLMSIMIKVNEEVSKATAQMEDMTRFKQSPAPVPTLRKRVFFRGRPVNTP